MFCGFFCPPFNEVPIWYKLDIQVHHYPYYVRAQQPTHVKQAAATLEYPVRNIGFDQMDPCVYAVVGHNSNKQTSNLLWGVTAPD